MSPSAQLAAGSGLIDPETKDSAGPDFALSPKLDGAEFSVHFDDALRGASVEIQPEPTADSSEITRTRRKPLEPGEQLTGGKGTTVSPSSVLTDVVSLKRAAQTQVPVELQLTEPSQVTSDATRLLLPRPGVRSSANKPGAVHPLENHSEDKVQASLPVTLSVATVLTTSVPPDPSPEAAPLEALDKTVPAPTVAEALRLGESAAGDKPAHSSHQELAPGLRAAPNAEVEPSKTSRPSLGGAEHEAGLKLERRSEGKLRTRSPIAFSSATAFTTPLQSASSSELASTNAPDTTVPAHAGPEVLRLGNGPNRDEPSRSSLQELAPESRTTAEAEGEPSTTGRPNLGVTGYKAVLQSQKHTEEKKPERTPGAAYVLPPSMGVLPAPPPPLADAPARGKGVVTRLADRLPGNREVTSHSPARLIETNARPGQNATVEPSPPPDINETEAVPNPEGYSNGEPSARLPVAVYSSAVLSTVSQDSSSPDLIIGGTTDKAMPPATQPEAHLLWNGALIEGPADSLTETLKSEARPVLEPMVELATMSKAKAAASRSPKELARAVDSQGIAPSFVAMKLDNAKAVIQSPLADGIGGAQQSAQMKQAVKLDEIAAPQVKLLPEHKAVTSISNSLPHGLSYAVVTPSEPGENSLPINPQDPSRAVPGSYLLNSISREIVTLRQSRTNSLAVLLKPDAHTEISLSLVVHGSKIEAFARCERGDFQLLHSLWPALQRSLEPQGVVLGSLQEASPGKMLETNLGSSGSPHYNQGRPPQSELSEASQRVVLQKPQNASKPTNQTKRLLESWA